MVLIDGEAVTIDIYIVGIIFVLSGLFMIKYCTYPAVRVLVRCLLLRGFDRKVDNSKIIFAFLMATISFAIIYASISSFNRALMYPGIFQEIWLDKYIVKRCIPAFLFMGMACKFVGGSICHCIPRMSAENDV